MSRSCTLLPFDSFPDSHTHYSHTVLPLWALDELFDALEELEETYGQPVPPDFTSHMGRSSEGERSYGATQENNQADKGRLRWLPAAVLVPLVEHPDVATNRVNLAAWAYLATRGPDTRVAVYWG